MLGIKEEVDVQKLFHCKECGQPLAPDLPGWKRTQLFTHEMGDVVVTVFFWESSEDHEDLTGWAWQHDLYDTKDDEALYETPEGAMRAADKWLAEHVGATKEADSSDSEGESSSPDESPK